MTKYFANPKYYLFGIYRPKSQPCVKNIATAKFHYFLTTHEVQFGGEGAN